MNKTKTFAAFAAAALSLGMLTACSDDTPSGDDTTGRTKLTVVGLLPGATEEAKAALDQQVADFENQYPDIDVEWVEYEWKATTFSADLAGGTLPDVFEIPLTDAQSLIANSQIADMDSYVKAMPYGNDFNPGVLQYGLGPDGHIYAIPAKSIYGIGLHYNRTLFTQAGLDPDKPPTTWSEVREYAKKIADAVPGVAGYAQMATSNTGGWQLTVATYARGGRMESVAADGTATATVDNAATKAALEFLKAMRWDDNSMGAEFNYDWGSINQAFAAGQVAMYTSGQDVYTSLVQANGVDPDSYGLTTIPLEGADSGVLGGGTLAAVNVKASDEVKDAAMKWIDYFYLGKYISEDAAVATAQLQVANNQPVGTPELPIFTSAQLDQYNRWIAPYVTVPLAQMKPFTDGIVGAQPIAEPPVATQDLYAALDPAVQAVLTDQNADIDALLATANTAAQRAIDANS
ncbi:MAG: extracellular solute-binding protein [Propionibacteriaceae bacterium]|jgi:ABC-type glycerol-3-phosphate transport system substrate-binding protein|nr:extracellular solute-binding protein [Propionibacteriaceae bacterium]